LYAAPGREPDKNLVERAAVHNPAVAETEKLEVPVRRGAWKPAVYDSSARSGHHREVSRWKAEAVEGGGSGGGKHVWPLWAPTAARQEDDTESASC
jgi:hypothetical protein